MKRIFAISIILILASSLVFAATGSTVSSTLTENQRAEYLSNALSIETREHTYTYTDAYTYPIGRFGAYTTYDTNHYSETNWYPYMGPTEISKLDFFRLTGYDAIVAQMEKDLKTQRALVISGGTLMTAGFIGVITGVVLMCTMDDILPGTITTCISAVAMGAGIPMMLWEPNDDISISFAVGVADDYNRKLLESIRNKR